MQRHSEQASDVEPLVAQLAGLGGVRAPATLMPALLRRLDLAGTCYRFDTPIGPVVVASNARGISAVRLAAETAEAQGSAGVERQACVNAPAPAELAEAIRRHLAGERGVGLRFDLRGRSDFERAVLLKALEIPRGEVRPYAWVAREIGRPRAVRAVGSALGRNPVPLLIPCHRVVRSDGQIGNYIFGSQAKRALLEAEGVRLA